MVQNEGSLSQGSPQGLPQQGGQRTGTESPHFSTPTPSEQQAAMLAAVEARIAALEKLQNTVAKPPNLSKAVRRPEPFLGTQKDKNGRTVEIWLRYMEFYLEATRIEVESDKMNVAASHWEADLSPQAKQLGSARLGS